MPAVFAVADHGLVAHQQHIAALGVVEHVLELLAEFLLGQGRAVGVGGLGLVVGVGKPGRVERHQPHERGNINDVGPGAAFFGNEGVLAVVLFDVLFEPPHPLEAIGAGVGPVPVAGHEVKLAVGQPLHQRNKGINPLGLAGAAGVLFTAQALIAHHVAQMHDGKRTGLLLQGAAQGLKVAGRQVGAGRIAQQENLVGRSRSCLGENR